MTQVSSIRELTGIAPPQAERSDSLGQQDFLELMITQLRNQDPFKPMENGDFLGQMAQFSTVSGIQELQNSFAAASEAMASNQALQAASLVDRDVLVPADGVHFDGENPARMAVALPQGARDARVSVLDDAGDVVAVLSGSRNGGRAEFAWDGTDRNGDPMDAGVYSFRAEYRAGNQTVSAESYSWARVESVSLSGARGVSINLAGLGSLPLSQAVEIS